MNVLGLDRDEMAAPQMDADSVAEVLLPVAAAFAGWADVMKRAAQMASELAKVHRVSVRSIQRVRRGVMLRYHRRAQDARRCYAKAGRRARTGGLGA